MSSCKPLFFLLVLLNQFKNTKQFSILSFLFYAYIKTNILHLDQEPATPIQVPFGAVPLIIKHKYAETFCTRYELEDGIYGPPCHKNFIICQKRVPRLYRCPDDTVFYPDKNECGQPTISYCNSTNICDTLKDGIYGRQCSINYVICNNHTTDLGICSKYTFFNVASGKCDEVGEVPECGKDTANAPTFNYLGDNMLCADFPDGIYGFPCSRSFVICFNHEQIHYRCPPDTAFNAATEWCENVANVTGCQKRVPKWVEFALPLY